MANEYNYFQGGDNENRYWENQRPTTKCRVDFLRSTMPESERRAYSTYLRDHLDENIALSDMLDLVRRDDVPGSIARQIDLLETRPPAHFMESEGLSSGIRGSLPRPGELAFQLDLESEQPLETVPPERPVTLTPGESEASRTTTYTLMEAKHRACDLLLQWPGDVELVWCTNVESTADTSLPRLRSALQERAEQKLGPVRLILIRAALGLQFCRETSAFLRRGFSLPEIDGHRVDKFESFSLFPTRPPVKVVAGYKNRRTRLEVLARAVAFTAQTDTELLRLARETGGQGELKFALGYLPPVVSLISADHAHLALGGLARGTLDTLSPVFVAPSRDNALDILAIHLHGDELTVATNPEDLVRRLSDAEEVAAMFRMLVGCQDPFVASP